MITHGSNKSTGLSNSHNDHDTASVSQRSKDTRSPFYTPERRTRADSAGSEQKYSHKPRLSTSSVTLNKHHSEDDLSDDTNDSQHSELDDTEKMYQHNIPQNESEPNDMQQRIKAPCNRVLLRIFSMTSDTRQHVKQPERNNKFKKIIIDTYREEYAIVAETEDLDRRVLRKRKSNYKSLRQGRRTRKPILHCLSLNNKTVCGVDADEIRRF